MSAEKGCGRMTHTLIVWYRERLSYEDAVKLVTGDPGVPLDGGLRC